MKLSDKENLINTYMHGKCHLFALVAAELNSSNIHVLWDTEAYSGDGLDIIDEDCLVHAFIKVNDGACVFDAMGYKDFDDYNFNFPCNSPEFSEFTIEQFEDLIISKGWGGFVDGERALIRSFINFEYFTIPDRL